MRSAILRPARWDELRELSALCLRSKAHWGYDAAFMAACQVELTLCEGDLSESHIQVIEDSGRPVALAQVVIEGGQAEILKLFVDPHAMGKGYGRRLMDWILNVARQHNAGRLRIEADPDAAAFYERMGARYEGEAPSESIPGRSLPLLYLDL